MYVSISQEVSRQHRADIMHEVKAARQAGTTREATSRLMRNLRWELARYGGLISKQLRK